MPRKQPKYVSLEPKAFLSDFEFQAMTAEQRGVYCTLIFSLYANNGRLKYDEEALRKLCNVKTEFSFQTVFRKFIVRRGFIRHKRVTQELQKAQLLVDRSVKAANTRWNKQCPSIAQASNKQCQGKVSKGKVSNSSIHITGNVTNNDNLDGVEIPIYTLKDFLDAGIITGLSIPESEACYDYYKGEQFTFRSGQPIMNAADACKRWRNNRQNFANKKPTESAYDQVAELKARGDL